MGQLTNRQYDVIERAVAGSTRIAVSRSGGRELVFVPLKLRVLSGREAIETRNPTTGDDMTIFLDEIDKVEAVR